MRTRLPERPEHDAPAAEPEPEPEPEPDVVTHPGVESRAVVELRGIKKSFGSTEVLHGVDLTVHAGEHVVVFGPSGSGKSTLLRSINLLEFFREQGWRF